MIVSSNTTPSSDEKSAALTSYSSSIVSTSPPPYDVANSGAPSLVGDGKRRVSRPHRGPHRESKPAYKDSPLEFSRVPTINPRTLKPFEALTVLVEGSGRSLDKGLSLELPPSTQDPHPFTQRDISTKEWQRFMQDLRDGTAMSDYMKQKSLIVPLAIGLGPGAFFVSRAIKARVRRKKLVYGINLINTWNQHFFSPRGVEVILMRGDLPLTTVKSAAKSTANKIEMHHENVSSASLSSDSSSRSSSSSRSKAEMSGGCCNQPRTPLRLVVVPT